MTKFEQAYPTPELYRVGIMRLAENPRRWVAVGTTVCRQEEILNQACLGLMMCWQRFGGALSDTEIVIVREPKIESLQMGYLPDPLVAPQLYELMSEEKETK